MIANLRSGARPATQVTRRLHAPSSQPFARSHSTSRWRRPPRGADFAGRRLLRERGDECLTTRTYFEQQVWSAFMSTTCTKCHTPDGIAVAEQEREVHPPAVELPGLHRRQPGQPQRGVEDPVPGHVGAAPQADRPDEPRRRRRSSTRASDEYKALGELVNRLGSATPAPSRRTPRSQRGDARRRTVHAAQAPRSISSAACPPRPRSAAVDEGRRRGARQGARRRS